MSSTSHDATRKLKDKEQQHGEADKVTRDYLALRTTARDTLTTIHGNEARGLLLPWGNVTSLKDATVGAAMKTTRGAKSAVRNTLSAYNQRGFIMHM